MKATANPDVQDRNSSLTRPFCPPQPPALEPFLHGVMEIGGDIIDLYGLRVPRIHEPTREPYRSLLDPSLALTIDEAVEEATWEANNGRAPRHPGRNLRYCLESAYLHRIEGLDTWQVRNHLRLRDRGEPLELTAPGVPDRMRSRSAARVIRSGDAVWAALGGWPWALHEHGRLPHQWWGDPRVSEELAGWHEKARRDAAESLRTAQLRLTKARALAAAQLER